MVSAGFYLMFIGGGIYSLFHDRLHIVSPRHGFNLTEPFKITASIGLICMGTGFLFRLAVRETNDINGIREGIRVLALLVGIVGALAVILAFFLHYSLTLL